MSLPSVIEPKASALFRLHDLDAALFAKARAAHVTIPTVKTMEGRREREAWRLGGVGGVKHVPAWH